MERILSPAESYAALAARFSDVAQAPFAGIPLSDAEFDYFRALAYEHAGITLPDYKRNMVYRRVSKRLTALKLPSFKDYAELLAGRGGKDELEFFVNALTTNKTEFFREEHHFEHLASLCAPGARKPDGARTSNRLRIWSAGCSSGQEPYTIAITLRERLDGASLIDAKILATDIDTDMVQTGERGIYPMSEFAALPPVLRQKYVEPVPDRPGHGRMARELRALITFNPLNLHGAWPMAGRFDVIFCRNVMIYFDKKTQVQLLDRFANLLGDGGYLYIGHSESLYRVTERFQAFGQSIYRKIA